MQKTSSSPTLASIQILRGLAALMIVIWHSDLSVELFQNDFWRDVHPIQRAQLYPFWANHLGMGVDIFFCISGFIMTLLAHKASRSDAWPFLRDRIARIAPPYWFFTICFLVLYSLSDSFHTWRMTGLLTKDVPATLLSFLLLPQKNGPILAIGWTLIHEFMFYYFVCFIIFLNQGKRLVIYLAFAALLGIAFRLFGFELFLGYLFSDYYVEFFAGALTYVWRDRLSNFSPVLLLGGGMASYLSVSYAMDVFLHAPANNLIQTLGSSLTSFLLIGGMLGVEKRHRIHDFLFGRWAIKLGDASYSLYLSHWFSLSLIGKLAAPFWEAPAPIVILWQVTSICTAIVLALLFAHYVELPLHTRLVLWLKKSD